MTPKIKHVYQGKIYLCKSKMTPKNEMSTKEKYFTVNLYT
jgi:hypothetical protein